MPSKYVRAALSGKPTQGVGEADKPECSLPTPAPSAAGRGDDPFGSNGPTATATTEGTLAVGFANATSRAHPAVEGTCRF
jgi:hypothetical protein